jgi:hypothetical protein
VFRARLCTSTRPPSIRRRRLCFCLRRVAEQVTLRSAREWRGVVRPSLSLASVHGGDRTPVDRSRRSSTAGRDRGGSLDGHAWRACFRPAAPPPAAAGLLPTGYTRSFALQPRLPCAQSRGPQVRTVAMVLARYRMASPAWRDLWYMALARERAQSSNAQASTVHP